MKSTAGAWNNIANIEKELVKMGIPTTDVIKKHEVSNRNSWTCSLTGDGSYQVCALRQVLDVNNSIDERKLWWIKEVPIKVTCFVWRAKLGRIPTTSALSTRGISLPSTSCCQCGHNDENDIHVLVQCPFAKTVLKEIFHWCQIVLVDFQSVNEVLDYASNWGNCPKKKRRLMAIRYGTLWSIWKTRNERVFNNRKMCATKVVDIIILSTFLWFKDRNGKMMSYGQNGFHIHLAACNEGFKALHLIAILHFLSCLEKFSVIIEIELYSYVLHTNQSDQSISLRTDTIGA
ncbi:unnamed protein product [Lactuca saligna]|uniref:Reverse transcriptase zinc-binding domain-containing protein n=1 Tax=Lactuca saligna TaxID=75948 RepID=A0AA35ZQB4_LACSI|nr:unnamed protein product [Lactuca saligna]